MRNKPLVHLIQYKVKLGFSEHNKLNTELHNRITYSSLLTLSDLSKLEDHSARKMV